jgi:peroxiredoxin
VVVAIDTAEAAGEDPVAKAKAFKEKHGLTYPILVDADGKVRESFGVMAFPTNAVIDQEGKVRSIGAGFIPGAILQELMGK